MLPDLREGAPSDDQGAHGQGALQVGSDVLPAQWADADDEVDLGELFLGISMDDQAPSVSL